MNTLQVVRVLTGAAAVGSGLLGGVYLAFSTAVMPALARRPPAEATAVMQEVNRVILNPVFGTLFTGTALACLATAASPLVAGGAGSGWRVAGGVAGLAAFVPTFAVNIPLNTGLDRDGVVAWAGFAQHWTPSNHLRAALSVLAAVLLLLAVPASGSA
ncbi:putative membrane protein [Pseudonocardia sediminis]|uniref:Putative membrane protein n=1 Tax=Pseudonocardia sediminis TaxID=1397368 RepID=A0A4Q7V5Z2_PSEST|nr:anthrone oxygenase family protein [Pseudonocardia sediminis]RZT88924.1 putative membrane protein [Pseudonocardia sediminis]